MPLPPALNHLLRNGKAVCGAMREEEMEALFQEHAADIRSAAMVPLEYQGRLGLLAIGSKSAMHFRSSLGTLFITHIGQVPQPPPARNPAPISASGSQEIN